MSKIVNIIWADDEIDLLKSHILFLEDKGFNITTATSGEEAYNLFCSKRYDLVLLDEMMTGMGGIETLKKIKNINPSIPIILITKNEEEWLMDEAIASQISDYLIKPVNPSQIFLSCKKNLSSDQIQSDKIIQDFLNNYNQINENIKLAKTLDEWMELIDEVISWEIKLEESNIESIDYFLFDLKDSLNKNFIDFIEDSYTDLLQQDYFPNSVLDKYIKPIINKNQKVALIVLDCLRYDQAKKLLEKLYTSFDVKISPALSFIPTTTEYSRNSIFSGLLPAEIKDSFPLEWNEMNNDKSKLNQYEKYFLEQYCAQNLNKDISIHYDKVIEVNQGEKINKKIKDYRNIDFISIVVNFIDILGHASVKSKIIKEIIPNDKAYRQEVKNWFDNSWLYNTILEFKKDNRKVIITSDHGTTLVKRPVIIKADKNTTTGLRYKKGRNLRVNKKEGITIKTPSEYSLPKTSDSENYIISKSDYFFVYPNDYNHYKKIFKNSFQHGGVSIDEMVVPIIELK